MTGNKISIHWQRALYVVSDWLTTSLAFILFNLFRYQILYEPLDSFAEIYGFILQPKLIWEQILIPLFALGIYWLSGYYYNPLIKSRLQELLTTLCSAFINTIFIYFALLTNDQLPNIYDNWELIFVLIGLLFFLVYAGRILITTWTNHRLRKREWSFRTLIIGDPETSEKLAYSLSHSRQSLGYDVVGIVDINGPEKKEETLKEGRLTLEEVPEIAKSMDINAIILAPKLLDEQRILSILFHLFPLNIPIKIAPDTLSFMTSSIRLQDIYGEPFVDLTSPSVPASTIVIKRFSDVILSSLAMLLTAPLMAAVALAIRLDSDGPVFYSQERIGRHQKPFNIYKFRTMRRDAEKMGPQLSKNGDPRITRVGRFLRKYRMDELPQFWNVFKGDMSLVGPRPEREYYIRKIVEKAPYYTIVHQVRPGITSWGMVKYGYASTVDEMVRRVRFDLIYLSNMSLSVDLKILIYTVKTVLGGEGK